MNKRDKVMIILGCLTIVLGITCGICMDVGLDGTAFVTGVLAVVALVALGPASEMSG